MKKKLAATFKLQLAIFIVSLLCCTDVNAIPACPDLIDTQQPDGTAIMIRQVGDEWSHYTEDQDGRTIVKDKDTGYWVYAGQDASGDLIQTPYKVGITDISKINIPLHLKSASAMVQRKEAIASYTLAKSQVPTPISSGTVKNLVLLVAFKDKPFTYSADDFDKLFNEEGYSVDGAHGSVKDYYNEVSYGKLKIESIIAGPVTLSQGYAYYGADSGGKRGNDIRPQKMVEEALDLLAKTGFDFTQVDGNRDGWVDGFDVIHSGYDQAQGGGDPNCIWSHNWVLTSVRTYGEVSFCTYHTEAELYTRNGKLGITAIGVPCHETGHFLGLPDLYDPDYTSSGIGRFCLMSGGSWCGGGLRPAHMSAWCKEYLGWVEPTEITGPGEYSLQRVEDNAQIFKIKGNLPGKEYFLLENRQGCLFDSSIPGAKRGMLIWHVDNSLSISDNNFNTNPEHFGVDLEEASGTQHLEDTTTSSVTGDDLDYFRSDTMSSFTSTTTPNSKGYSGIELGFDIKNISASGHTMTFSVSWPRWVMDVNPQEKQCPSVATEGSFSVTANSSWTTSASDSWITLKTTSGSGNGTVYYEVEENKTGEQREGTIIVKCGSETATHAITQSAEAAKLILKPTTSDVSCAQGSGNFEVQANYSWTVSTTAPWITLNSTEGSGNGIVLYSFAKNTDAQREGMITVKSGSLTATHTVTQAAQPQLSINPSVNNCSADATHGSFKVTSDSMWTVTTSATWIKLNTVSGSGNGTVTYSIDENTGNSRQGFIYVTSGSVKSTHMVAQTRMEGITFVPSSQSVNVSGSGDTGTFTFTVMGNTRIVSLEYSQVDWASWSFSREDITEGAIYTCTYTVNANTTYGTRSVNIPITFNGSEYNFKITQGVEADYYLVTYRPGALGTGSETYDIKQKNVSLKLRRDIFTRTDDYEQSGWATSDGGGKVYDLGAAYTENASITLYPYWTPKTIPNETYNIYLRPGSHGEGKEQTLIKTKGVTLTLPGALYKRVGYEQTGWSQAISGSSKTYDLGGKYTKDVMTYLYPYWTKVEEESFEADFGFYRPNGWKSPVYLCTTNTEWWTYVPQYVFSQDDSLRLNYCINNYSETQTVNVNNRLISLLAFDGEVITSVSESFDGVIQPLYMMHYRTSNVESWLSQCAPGNYAIKMTLDPDDELNDIDKSDNAAIQWFAVKADGVSYNEALDCTSLWFEADSDEFAPFAQTSVSVTGGSCLQFGPQPTNSYDTVLWGYVTEPGRLSFKWKALGNDYKNCMVFYVGDEMKTWKWGGQGDWETSTIEISESDVASGYVWISWKLWTYDADMSVLSVGWLDNVVWNPTGRKPTFTVSNDGKLTKIVLNGVTDLEIPSMVNSIAVRSIGYCALTNTAITSLSIPNTVTNIEPFAFWRNDKLSGVTIPGSVLTIGENAFGDCKAIKSIQIEEGVKTIGNYAFYGCDSVMTVGIPASVVNICQSPFGKCLNLRTITVANENSRYEILNHALVDKTSMTLVQYPSGCIESKYIISDGITSIGYDAFDSVSYLTNVTLPESVTSLDRFAFYMCSNLNVLTFKGDAPSVGDYAFLGVSSLCKAMVSPQSSGWGVPIPGTWQGLDIEYSAALQRYSVTYNPGACGIGIQMSETKSYGITLPLKGAIYKRTGYSQTGWATSDGGAKAYELGASYTTDSAVTLYPYWEANTYSVAYELEEGGTTEAAGPSSATYGVAFCVPVPTRDGYEFMGWMVTAGLDVSTARYGESADSLLAGIYTASQQCFNGSDVDVWFINLTPVADGNVTLTATWEPVPDDSRDVGFYAPASKGWEFPVCLSSTNINYLAYAPETEFVQFSDVFLSFCAVNWSTAGSAMLQSTLLTITDESGAVFDQGEPILVKSLGAFGYAEVRNLSMRRYMSGITPGHYKLTLELDPNRLLSDPDLSNNITSIWFTVAASTDPIPELPSDATAADVRVALADSVDGRLAENISDVSTYAAYREWARGAKGVDGNPAGVESVKSSNKAWFSFAVDSSELIEKEILSDDVKIEDFALVSGGGRFDFTVGITDVTIGDGATTARLKTIFGVEGATTLEDSAFSADNLILETAEPESGKVKLTVKPPAPKTGEEDTSTAFFMRIRVND